MRAREPEISGYAERGGVKVYYEVSGAGTPTILLLPPWSVVHSRTWKMQVPYLARHYRVVAFDGRGNGRSDRPPGAASYLAAEYAADALAVMDATGTERAVVVSLSRGAAYSLHLAAARPERVTAQVFISPTTPLAPFSRARMPYARSFEEHLGSDHGWAKDNAAYWQRDYAGFLEFFFSDDKVCIVTVGGSGVGADLLRRVIESFPHARQKVPGLRMVAVAGPRVDPAQLPAVAGVETHRYVHDLYRHLAVCDLAVVQGGLTTTMELVASNRPFLYFPLGHHFEQTFHVPHRLARYGAGRRMDYPTSTPESIAAAITEEIGKPVAYPAIDHAAVGRVAACIAEML